MQGQDRLPGETLDALGREVSRLKADLYGKGPEETKTFQNDHFLFCIMKGGLTTVERTLLEARDAALVREVRLRFQDQMRDRFVDVVERITDRRVLGYQSQVIFDPDYVIEIFILGPSLDD